MVSSQMTELFDDITFVSNMEAGIFVFSEVQDL